MSPISPPRALVLASLILLSGCQKQLVPGVVLEQKIRLDGRQRVGLDFEAGRFYHLIADQPSVDVVLTLYDPDGERVHVDIDTTTGLLEHLYFIPPETGRYELEVHGLQLLAEAADGKGRYTLALEPPREPSDNDRLVTEASWQEARGLEAYAIEEDSAKAEQHYRAAARLWERAGRPHELAYVLLELGSAQCQLGLEEQGQVSFSRVLDLAVEVDDRLLQIRALTSLGSTSRSTGQLQLAEGYHLRALAAAEAINSPKDAALALSNLCVLYTELGSFDRAEASCHRALRNYQELGLKKHQVRSLGNLGFAYRRRGDWAMAIQTYRRALEVDASVSRLTSTILASQARALLATNDFDGARSLLVRSLKMCIELGEKGSEAMTRGLLARVLAIRGEHAAAEQEAEAALEALELVDNVILRIGVLADAALVDLAAARLLEAEEKANRAFLLIEQMRQTPRNFDDRSTFLAAKWSIYDIRVAARMRLFEATKQSRWRDAALHAAEAARARGLVDRLQSADDSGENSARPGVLEPTEIQKLLLGRDTGLLHFHLGAEGSYLWRVTSDGIESFNLRPASELGALGLAFHRALIARELELPGASLSARGQRIEEADIRAQRLGSELAQALHLDEAMTPEIERWVIIPDGALHRIPFAALPNLLAVEKSWRPLLADFELIYAPSASSLEALRSSNTPRQSDGFMAFADPVFQADDPRNPSEASPDSSPEELPRLPLTRAEALKIASFAPARAVVIEGHAASKKRAMGRDLTEFGYLHFATHGLIDEQAPARSALALSRFDQTGRQIDGELTVRELENIDFQARLVVLSACRSATGQELRGEGVIGLARAFMNAGVPRVIASQWAVQDGLTLELMTSLYKKIWRADSRPAQALREAQLEQWQRGLPPYYWAAFQFQGEWL